MTKRVFKIVGIVIGAVAVLAGAIFGVMALMGKFRNDPVYPEALSFENATLTVEYDEDNPNKLYSFTILGTTSADAEVNQTKCYVRPLNTFGNQTLITLCDSNGNPLTTTSNGYQTNCNQPTYFRVNSTALNQDATNYGFIQLEAVGDAEYGLTSSTRIPLTISVDRIVKSLYIDNGFGDAKGNTTYNPTGSTQNITLGLSEILMFDYLINPSDALKPLSTRQEKEIYVYIRDTSVEGEYVLLKAGSQINQTAINRYSFLSNEGGKIKFTSPSAAMDGSYTFMLAMYPTYARQDAGDTETNAYNHIKNLVNTTVTINVINSNVSNVEMGNTQVNTTLYHNTNIAINDNTSSNQSLQLSFEGANIEERYNNIRFGALNGAWTYSNIYFANQANVDNTFAITSEIPTASTITVGGVTYNINLGEIKYVQTEGLITVTRTLINSLTASNGRVYKSNSGLAFLREEQDSLNNRTYRIEMLTSNTYGAYFDFVYLDNGNYISATDFECDVEEVVTNQGDRNSWKLTPKTMPSGNLQLIILVINNDGTYAKATTAVNVVEEALDVEELPNQITLDIGYEQVGGGYQQTNSSINFEDIVKITAGSYTATAFVVEYNANQNYPFRLLEKDGIVTFEHNGKFYAIVGYIDVTDNFVNAICANDNTNSAIIKIAQFKNAYGVSTKDYIENAIENNSFVAASIKDVDIEVNVDYILTDAELFDANFVTEENDNLTVIGDEIYAVANSSGHVLIISSYIERLFDNLNNSNHLKDISFKVYNANDNEVNSVINFVKNPDTGYDFINWAYESLTLNFSVGGQASTKYYIKMLYQDEVVWTSLPINIILPSTSGMSYYYGSNNSVTLSTSEVEADRTAYVKVDVTFASGRYNYSYYLMDGDGKPVNLTTGLELNATSQKTSPDAGFYATINYAGIYVEHNLRYDTKNSSVASITNNAISINALGTTYITITTTDSSQTWYLRLDVTAVNDVADGFNLTTIGSGAPKKDTVDYLSNYVRYTYKGQQANNLMPFVNIDKVRVTDFGGSYNTKVEKIDNGFEVVDANTNSTVLTITKTATDWEITRSASYLSTNVSIVVTVSVLTQTNTLDVPIAFDSNLSIRLSSAWENTYYANTNVVLAEVGTDKIENTPIFRIIDSRADNITDLEVFYQYSAQGEFAQTSGTSLGIINANSAKILEWTLGQAGSYKFIFYVVNEDGTKEEINSTILTVKENAIAVADKQELRLNMDTVYALNNSSFNIDFYQFKTDVTFGLKDGYMYNNIANLNVIADVKALQNDNLTITSSEETILSITSEKSLKTGWIENLQANETDYTYSIGLSLNGYALNLILVADSTEDNGSKVYSEIDSITIKVVNQLKFVENAEKKTEFSIGYNSTDKQYQWTVFETYDASHFGIDEQDDFYLHAITTTNNNVSIHTITDATNKIIAFYWTIEGEETVANLKYTVPLTFEFVNENDSNKKLIYTTNSSSDVNDVLVKPYIPDLNNTNPISGADYDLVNDVFDMVKATSEDANKKGVMFNGDNVTSLVVTSVSNNNLVNSDISYIGAGYVWDATRNLWEQNSCLVNIASITGNSAILTVDYTITYTNGISYQFSVNLIVKNGQVVEVVYPYSIANSTSQASVIFNSNIVTEADLQDLGAVRDGSVYKINLDNFETVYLTDANESVVIDLANDPLLSLSRVQIGGKTSDVLNGFTVEKLAWYSGSRFENYNNNSIHIDNTKVIFDYPTGTIQSWAETPAYVIFKITSAQGGAVGYYKVVLYLSPLTNDVARQTSITNYAEIQANSPAVGESSNVVTAGTSLNVLGTNVTEFNNAFNLNYANYGSALSFYLASAQYADGSSGLDAITIDNATATIGCNLNNAKLNTIYNYLTLKIVVIYTDANRAINIGSLVVYVKPLVSEKIVTTIVSFNKVTDKITGNYKDTTFNTGYYTATIINQEEVAVPFNLVTGDMAYSYDVVTATITNVLTEGFTLTNNAINYQASQTNSVNVISVIADVNSSNLSVLRINNYTDKAVEFVVKYTFLLEEYNQQLSVYVVYTLNAISLDNEIKYITLGNRHSAETGFNNTLSIADIVTDYNKEIILTNTANQQSKKLATVGNPNDAETSTEVFNSYYLNYKYDENGRLYFIFELPTQTYHLDLSVTLEDYIGRTNTVRLDVTVEPSVRVVNNSAAEVNAMVTALTNNYKSEVGSVLDVYITRNDNYMVFNITSNETVTTITTLANSSIKLEFTTLDGVNAKNYVYLQQGETEENLEWLALTTDNIKIEDPGKDGIVKIGFAHMGKDDTILLLNVKVYNDKNVQYTQEINSYIKIAQTYSGLIAQYEVNGSDHDVRYANDVLIATSMFTAIGNNTKDLSDNNIFNTWRFALMDAKGNELSADEYDLSLMGFTNKNNVNGFTMAPSGVMERNGENFKFTTPSSTSNNTAILTLRNLAGVSNLRYVFRVLPSSATLTGEGVHTIKEGDIEKTYLTVTGSGNGTASIADANNNVFYIAKTNEEGNGNSILTININNGGATEIPSADISSSNQNGATITTITANNITITIRVEGSILTVSTTGLTSNITNYTLTLTMYGNGLIAKNFEIVYLNYTAETRTDTPDYYGADTIEMKDLFNVKKAGAELTQEETSTIGYILKSATFTKYDASNTSTSIYYQDHEVRELFAGYTVDGEYYYFASMPTIFNGRYNSLTLNNIAASRLTINLTVDVLINGKTLQTLQKTVTVLSNIKMQINKNDVADNGSIFNYIMTDNNLTYTLKSASNQGQFAYNMDLKANNVDNNLVRINKIDYDTNYYLNFVDSKNPTSSLMGLVSEYSVQSALGDDKAITCNNGVITFTQDYTGALTINIRVNLGEYQGIKNFSFVVNVLGFANINYNGSENDIKGGGGSGYAGGSVQNVIVQGTTTDTGVGVLYSTTAGATFNSQHVAWNGNYNIMVNSQYAITNQYNNSTGMDAWWNDELSAGATGSLDIDNATVLSNSNTMFAVTLPYISSNDSVYVVYRLVINYLGNKETIMYVTYRVQGEGIAVDTTKQAFNVDTELLKQNNNQYLPLFYYVEKYTETNALSGTDAREVSFTVARNDETGNNERVAISGGENYFFNSTENAYVNGDSKISYPSADNEGKLVMQIGEETIEVTKDLINTYESAEDENIKSVYRLNNINNVETYQLFINSLNKVSWANVAGNTESFKLSNEIVATHIAGLYAIDLASATPIFNNRLTGTMSVEVLGGASLQTTAITLSGSAQVASNNPTKKLSEMFANQAISLSTDSRDIIGISNVNSGVNILTDWVSYTNANGEIIEGATISSRITRTGEAISYNNQTFRVNQITYSVDNSGNSLYTLEATYYYLYSTTGCAVVLNTSNGIYEQTCNAGANNYSTDVSNVYTVWSMGINGITDRNDNVTITYNSLTENSVVDIYTYSVENTIYYVRATASSLITVDENGNRQEYGYNRTENGVRYYARSGIEISAPYTNSEGKLVINYVGNEIDAERLSNYTNVNGTEITIDENYLKTLPSGITLTAGFELKLTVNGTDLTINFVIRYHYV